jgi:hypothetical protein
LYDYKSSLSPFFANNFDLTFTYIKALRLDFFGQLCNSQISFFFGYWDPISCKAIIYLLARLKKKSLTDSMSRQVREVTLKMAKLESENNSLIVECVKKDASEMEFIIKVKSYGMEASFPLVATVENFETFLTQIQLINEKKAMILVRTELIQLFEDKGISFEGDGWLSYDAVKDVGIGRVIVSGHNSAFKNKGNDYRFQFIVGHTVLVEFLWELSEMRS